MAAPDRRLGILGHARRTQLTGEGRMAVSTAIKSWTLQELHSLPEDGNKYELLEGELLVTPAPAPVHELVLARLTHLLVPYVESNDLGYVYRPRAIIRHRPRTEVEPDLFVSRAIRDYDRAPTPILVVEVLSPYTRRRDLEMKQAFYLGTKGIPEYWIVDPESRAVIVAREGAPDEHVTGQLTWMPAAVADPLSIDVASLFS
jgi:Uma2 family endonuclease